VAKYITFEHPLNERIRAFLRLEHLFKQADFFLSQDSVWTVRALVNTYLDIAGITGRSDIKSEILKELDRHLSSLARIRHQRGVDLQMLDQVLGELEGASTRLYSLEGPLGVPLRENDLLKSVAQRGSIPGGTCSFDLPQFHFWLEQSLERRRADLERWGQCLQPARDAIALLLSLTRGSSAAREVTASQGFFQENLNPENPTQMLRIGLPLDATTYPEVSGHKHRFSIRFLHSPSSERAAQIQEDVAFLLTCCVI
jgi:cell division protein ZapD